MVENGLVFWFGPEVDLEVHAYPKELVAGKDLPDGMGTRVRAWVPF